MLTSWESQKYELLGDQRIILNLYLPPEQLAKITYLMSSFKAACLLTSKK